eukprot:3415741-Amphidinium_carterae.1
MVSASRNPAEIKHVRMMPGTSSSVLGYHLRVWVNGHGVACGDAKACHVLSKMVYIKASSCRSWRWRAIGAWLREE